MSLSAQNRKHILLVEDDTAVGTMLVDILEDGGYRATLAGTGAEARAAIAQDPPDLIVLDLRLPDTDGLVLCADLNTRARAPIIIVSATNEKRDAILAFKLGAEDFVAKPFDVDHLLARIEATLRRTDQGSHRAAGLGAAAEPARAPAAATDERVRRAGNLVMDHARRQVTIGSTRIPVTPTEYRILETLMEHSGEVITRDELAMKVWGFQDAGIGRSLDVHIRRLRIKMAGADAPPPAILAVRGFGYRLDPEPVRELAAA